MIALKPDTPVVILGASHNPALGVARSLGRHGVPLIGIGTNPRSSIHASRYFTRMHAWDVLTRPPAESIAFLKDIARRQSTRPILLATYDDGVIFMADHADALADSYLFPRQPAPLVRSFCNKRELHDLVTRLGIPTALSSFPQNADDVEAFLARTRFPVVMKGIDGARLERRCGFKHLIVHNANELRRRYREFEDPADPNVMLQEYIPGNDADMWLFDGYFDEHADCQLAFTGRKLRQAPIHSGAACFGVCTWNQTIADQTISLMKAVGYAGMLDVDYRYDHRDGLYKLLDPNPRVGSTFRLFVSDAGLDVVQACYLHLTGQALPEGRPVEGRTWVSEDTDLLAAFCYWREGSLTWHEWRASLKGIGERAWFVPADLMPFWIMCMKFVALIGRAIARRFRTRLRRAGGRPAPQTT
ncbi:MAG: hypothetical protein K8T26_20225 [Lentisphaerae bacterium]|nr:hypothetical protein [Lentisphaerota bacterium]